LPLIAALGGLFLFVAVAVAVALVAVVVVYYCVFFNFFFAQISLFIDNWAVELSTTTTST